MLSINDRQYDFTINNNSININNQSLIRLFLGGIPTTSLASALYSTVTNTDTFRGCIRNVLSNGIYLDMNRPLIASDNSRAGQCNCSVTNSCTIEPSRDSKGVIVPWYVWLIIGLILFLLGIILLITILLCIRRKRQQRLQKNVYVVKSNNFTSDNR